MEKIEGLDSSIPANNCKIIEIYNKLRNGQLKVNKDYQRKLVWKRLHKLNFIDTILKNFPFPELYWAPGALDQEKLILIDEIVDGQQRLTTIKDYIEETDVFAISNSQIPKFSTLNQEQKTSFLNYEVSVRYLKNVNPEQVREIFQRINKTDYALNATERLNAQWGDSEFICFAKQLIEPEFDTENVQYTIDPEERKELITFFHGDDKMDEGVFSETDINRMYALQYIMTLIVTLADQKYFNRTEKVNSFIVGYNDSFPQADDLKNRLLQITRFFQRLSISRDSRWYQKANLFSLVVELDKVELSKVNVEKFSDQLKSLENKVESDEVKKSINLTSKKDIEDLSQEEEKYFNYAREAVNQKSAREYRGEFLRKLIMTSMK